MTSPATARFGQRDRSGVAVTAEGALSAALARRARAIETAGAGPAGAIRDLARAERAIFGEGAQ